MSEKVGSIHYDVTLETAQMIEGQRKIDRELQNTSKALDGFDLKLTSVARAVGILGAAMAALKSAQMADEMRMLSAQVQVAAGSMEAGASAMTALEASSKRTQTSIGANASVFNRLNQSMLQMGGTQQDTLNLTELLAKAIKVSGASATEGASAMTQFGQALGSGKLGGDELSSLLENAPYLMQKLAQGIGVPVGALKKMGEEGKLTADVVTNALNKAADQIDADFKKFPQTIASAMDVAQDAAGRLNSKMDELTGTSAAITGVVQGAGTVFDELAKQIAEATGESDKLGRNESIKGWAESTKVVLSYVVDAADGVIRVFKSLGKWIGAELAAAGAVMTGNFEEARTIIGLVGDDIDEIMQKQLAGQKMREAWASGAGKGLDAAPGPTGNKLGTSTAGTAGGKGGGKAKAGASKRREFDAEAYLAGLQKSVVSAMEAVDIAEQEAIRKNDELLQKGDILFEAHQAARTMILKNAQQERADLELKDAQQKKARFDKEAETAIRDEQAKQDAIKMANAMLIENDPAAKIRATYAAREAALQEGRMREFLGEDLQNKAIVANRESMNKALADLDQQRIDKQMAAQSQMYQGTSQLFGSLADLAKQGAGEQSDIYKTMFAASKAFAIADAMIKIQSAYAAAFGDPSKVTVEQKIGAAATIAAATAGIVSSISSTNYGGGRQYGGPVSGGSMYRVNETGAPEMFTANNGNQYMLPTKSGSVTSADKVGGGGISVSVSVDATGSTVEGNDAQAKQLGAMLGNVVMAKLIEQKRPGGILWK